METTAHGKELTPRVAALDALRGFAILAMVLSGVVPRGALPAWMYHAQNPPPTHQLDISLPGITWVDLVFPFFLFALGAAIPFALSRRLAAGASTLRIVGQVLSRGVLLLAFAIYIPHVDPWKLNPEPTLLTWLLALLAFALMFPALARLPKSWPRWRVWASRLIGWGGAIALVAGRWYLDGAELSAACARGGVLAAVRTIAARSDIIIVVLANMAVWASLIWLLARRSVLIRLLVMLAMLGARWTHDRIGGVGAIWDFHPVPQLYQLYFAQYLLIVLPGTIAGDLFLSRRAGAAASISIWSRRRLVGLAMAALALNVFVVAGLHARWLPWATPAGTAVILLAVAMLVRGAHTAFERRLGGLVAWGALWLVLGLLFEPREGGIKKSMATVSYYFVTAGLACFALLFFAAILDGLKVRRGARLLIDNGQNPMIAYLGIRNLLPPLLVPTGIERLIAPLTSTPVLGFLRALAETLLLAWIVGLFTRLRVYWRT